VPERLLIATTNPGKVREIRGILAGLRFDLVGLDGLPPIAEPDETGATFGENARLKALYYAAQTGLPAVADDSGIEIEALDGGPGIHSARWQGTDYPAKFAAIYAAIAARGWNTSPARFVGYVALAHRGAVLFEHEAVVEGTIAAAPCGAFGFGYDPIFYYPPYGCTLAEVEGERKAAVSHRGQTFGRLRDFLSTLPAGRLV
jgi:XTP/dITP diphosphohydrolase